MLDNQKTCACPNATCPRHGDCKACQAHHAANGNQSRCQREAEKK